MNFDMKMSFDMKKLGSSALTTVAFTGVVGVGLLITSVLSGVPAVTAGIIVACSLPGPAVVAGIVAIGAGYKDEGLGMISGGLAVLVGGALGIALLSPKAEARRTAIEAAPALKETASTVAPMTGLVTFEGDFNAPSLAAHFHADDISSVPARTPVQKPASAFALHG